MTAPPALAKAWFYARSHFTKALGVVGIIVGYLLQNQSTWVQWLSDKPRGIATKWLGIAVFALGVYNQVFPPKPPAAS